jgi:hypothetical protein
MIILQKNSPNNLVLNINNNARVDFTGYTLTFVHIMSQELKSYNISTSNSQVYSENDRYCTIQLNLQQPGQDLNYEGQYQLKIYGNGSTLVFTGMVLLEGTEEEPFFTTYVSNNENNENYIYIED